MIIFSQNVFRERRKKGIRGIKSIFFCLFSAFVTEFQTFSFQFLRSVEDGVCTNFKSDCFLPIKQIFRVIKSFFIYLFFFASCCLLLPLPGEWSSVSHDQPRQRGAHSQPNEQQVCSERRGRAFYTEPPHLCSKITTPHPTSPPLPQAEQQRGQSAPWHGERRSALPCQFSDCWSRTVRGG